MKRIKRYLKSFKKNKALVFIFTIFVVELFLRFYQIDLKNSFGYDQVEDAWVAKSIIVDRVFPLIGLVAKGNSGMYVGPAYCYLVAFFYWIFNLNPIAAGMLAGFTSIFTFWTIYFVAKKLFNIQVAILALIINTFTFNAIMFDRVQWPVDFIPSISLLIFYFLYKAMTTNLKMLIPLALLVGFSFNLHFTAIFFPLIIILSLPFFPKTKNTLKYILISLPLFFIWLVPNIIWQLQQKIGNSNFSNYFSTYYHGFHLRRVMQLVGDGLIQFDPYSISSKLLFLKFIFFPLFLITYLYRSVSKNKLIFCYLVLLWFIVPWFVFATYAGEISDYYFSINRFIVLIILSYFLYKVWNINNLLPKTFVVILLIYMIINNFGAFLNYKDANYIEKTQTVLKKIHNGEEVKFQHGVPESYIYYYLMRQKNN
jgi:4-amino-4-deoxy-L-arabinose transferase-like glycosyltransferase